MWRYFNILPLLRREYLSSEVNGLTNSPEILHITNRDFFQLNCLHSDQLIWSRWCRSEFNSVSAHLPCYLWKGPLKQDFLDIYLTTFFGVRKFKNISDMSVMFFWKCSKLNVNLENTKRNSENIFIYQINASENVAINYVC